MIARSGQSSIGRSHRAMFSHKLQGVVCHGSGAPTTTTKRNAMMLVKKSVSMKNITEFLIVICRINVYSDPFFSFSFLFCTFFAHSPPGYARRQAGKRRGE